MDWWLAMPPHRRLSDRRRRPSGTCRSTTLVSWSSWTVSASGGSAAPRHRLAVHRHRCRLGLHLGHPPGHPTQPLGHLDQRPGPPGRIGSGRPGLEAGAGDERQRPRVPLDHLPTTIANLKARQTFIRAGRPQTNGCVERVQQTILDECWKPAFARYLIPMQTGLRLDLERYLRSYNTEGAHTGRWTRGRTPEAVLGKAKLWHKKR
jgi:Integrase core domain